VSRYFNDVGEPLMTASQVRLEDELDELSRYEQLDAADYGDTYGRQDAMWEDLYEQQEDGNCPACGEQGCTQRLRYSRDEYTGEGTVYHYEDSQAGE
jgi:hypothetical protein